MYLPLRSICLHVNNDYDAYFWFRSSCLFSWRAISTCTLLGVLSILVLQFFALVCKVHIIALNVDHVKLSLLCIRTLRLRSCVRSRGPENMNILPIYLYS
jgi:hypothetical protein